MQRMTAVLIVAAISFASISLIGCQSPNKDQSASQGSSGTSAQVGSGTDTGTQGVSSGSVSPSK